MAGWLCMYEKQFVLVFKNENSLTLFIGPRNNAKLRKSCHSSGSHFGSPSWDSLQVTPLHDGSIFFFWIFCVKKKSKKLKKTKGVLFFFKLKQKEVLFSYKWEATVSFLERKSSHSTLSPPLSLSLGELFFRFLTRNW